MTTKSQPSADGRHAEAAEAIASEVTNLLVPNFCRACGSSDESSNCAVSHDETPPSKDPGIGRIVTYRRGLRRRTAVVVGGSDAAPVVVEDRGGVERTPTKFEEMPTVEDWMTIPSPLFRLHALSELSNWNGPVARWLSDNRESLLSSIGDRRAFALAAIGSGDTELAKTSGLSDSELAWLAMHTHRDSGDTKRAFDAALSLDANSYADHSLVLLEAIAGRDELLDDPRLVEHVGALSPDYPGWAVLNTAINGISASGTAALAADLKRLGEVGSAEYIDGLVTGKGSINVNPWTRASSGASLAVSDLEDVSADFSAIADDIIDDGKVDAVGVSSIESAYLRARISVDSATDDELRELEAFEELARRAYASGDGAVLEQLGEQAPSSASYYRTLDTIRRGDIPDDTPEDDTLKAVVASIRSGRAHPNALNDPSTWPVLSKIITDEDADGFAEEAAVWQLDRARGDLDAWQFESALTRARLALKSSDDEAIRDEALNIIGFVLYQQGTDESAISALEKALEGEYSANLQANIGIIAEDLQPDVAAHHLGRLAEEAPTLELQLAAARRAFGIWAMSSDAWDEDELAMPENLLITFRSLTVAEIPYADYVSLLSLLARADAEWVADSDNTERGPHQDSAARRLYRAKASHTPSDYVNALAAESKLGNEEEWYVREKDDFVESLRSLIFSEEGSIGPAAYAFGAIDAGLKLDDFDYVTIASGAAISILGAIADDEGTPSDKVRDMIIEAKKRALLLDEEQQERVEPLVALAGNRFGAVVADFHIGVHNQILEALQSMSAQLQGVRRRNVNWDVVEEALKPMRAQLFESADEVKRASALMSDKEGKENLQEIVSGFLELAKTLNSPKRVF